MNCLRSIHLLLALVVVSASLVALLGAAASSELSQDQASQLAPKQTESARRRFSLPKIFDFEQYKKLFKKTYHSLAEEMVRRKMMLARAFRAWISAIKYKYRRMNYYLAVNHMSDWTPVELDSMRNKHLNDDDDDDDNEHPHETDKDEDERQTDHESEVPYVDPNSVEAEIENLMTNEQLSSLKRELPPASESADRRRRKRNAPARDSPPRRRAPPTRSLSPDQLINTGQGVRLRPEVVEKVELNPESNNPQYEAPELVSHGLWSRSSDDIWDKLEWVRVPEIEPTRREGQQAAGRLGGYLASLSAWFTGRAGHKSSSSSSQENGDAAGGGGHDDQNSEAEAEGAAAAEADQFEDALDSLPDEVYFDHRDSNCLFLPRNQLKCGSCYAFVAIALAEWYHCMTTGKLVAFSEQYAVDCGNRTRNHGCNGGNKYKMALFINEYGLELRKAYPYVAKEDQCPYEPSTRPEQMGYIRMQMGAFTMVPRRRLTEFIEYSPLFMSINTEGDFIEYGGGVMDGSSCGPKGDHAVLMVGHGREDGQEYWLIRNSWSITWGEGGYLKLAKAATKACFHPTEGGTFGKLAATSGGPLVKGNDKSSTKYSIRVEENKLNDRSIVSRRQGERVSVGLFWQ